MRFIRFLGEARSDILRGGSLDSGCLCYILRNKFKVWLEGVQLLIRILDNFQVLLIRFFFFTKLRLWTSINHVETLKHIPLDVSLDLLCIVGKVLSAESGPTKQFLLLILVLGVVPVMTSFPLKRRTIPWLSKD